MPLFANGYSLSSACLPLPWKIDSTALSPSDWECLAAIYADGAPPVGEVVGIPRGGLAFAKALQKHTTPWSHALLVADDVYTTGASMTLALDALRSAGQACARRGGI